MRSFLRLLTLFLIAAFPPLAPAQTPWQAEWIGVEPAPRDTNLWLAYRKTFRLNEVPRKAVARVAVDSKYWLWVNGERVVFEGGLKRGPTPEDTYFDVVDLSGRLRQGENVVAVLVWYFGKDGFSHRSSGRAGLVMEADLGGTALRTDSTWKVFVHPAFGAAGPPYPNFRLSEFNIRFDARLDPAGWTEPAYDDAAWPNAASFGRPPAAPWNRLVERPIPLWKDFGIRPYTNAADLPRVSTGRTIRAKLPYNAQITPYFRIDAPEGLVVDIRTDNYRGGGAPNVFAEYITRRGMQAYEAPGWMNGHEVHYTFPEGVRILDLGFRETGYDTEFAGSFESDDPYFDRLWQEAARTLYITMRDTYMDCPDRERAQWWGDAVNESGETFYALSRSADLLTRKAILELMEWQRPDGTIYSPVPSGNWDKELPMQMLASVGWFGFWNYYLNTGDAETIHRVYGAVKRYVLDVWGLKENGLVMERTGGWTWGDWGEEKDLPLLYNGWYYLALRGLREMALLTGHDTDLPEIERRMASLKMHFDPTYWTGAAYRSPDYEGQTDDRGNALAVVAGLAGPERYPALREVLRTQRHASPYMEKYVGEALFQMGYPEDAMRRIKDRYREMVEDTLTTLYEGWGTGARGFGGGTYNHAWSGGPLTLMSQYAAGLAPLEPAWKSYRVQPRMGDFRRITTTVPSPQGPIRLRLEKSGGGLLMELDSPPGTTALVAAPRGREARIVLDGRPLWSAEGATPPEGVQFVGADEQYVRFLVGPGLWRFVSR